MFNLVTLITNIQSELSALYSEECESNKLYWLIHLTLHQQIEGSNLNPKHTSLDKQFHAHFSLVIKLL